MKIESNRDEIESNRDVYRSSSFDRYKITLKITNTSQIDRSLLPIDELAPLKFEEQKTHFDDDGAIDARKRDSTDANDERDGRKEPGGFPQDDQGETSLGQAQLWGGLPRCVRFRAPTARRAPRARRERRIVKDSD